MNLPNCPKCNENHTYKDGHMYVCPMCFYEWSKDDQKEIEESEIIRDANGNKIINGNDALIIQDLKLGKDTIKKGTKVKNIKILETIVNNHDIEGKIDGFGNLYLKSSVIKMIWSIVGYIFTKIFILMDARLIFINYHLLKLYDKFFFKFIFKNLE